LVTVMALSLLGLTAQRSAAKLRRHRR